MKIFLKSKLVSLNHEIDVKNEEDETLYKVESKFISIHDKTELMNVKTNEKVADIHRKPISIHEVYYVDMTNGKSFELNTEIFKIINTQINIEGLGWTINGNMLQHDFDIHDEDGQIIASSHKKWVSLHEAYEVDVNDESKLDTIVAIYVTLDHILATREQNDASTTIMTMNND